jgi:hypothetical protein
VEVVLLVEVLVDVLVELLVLLEVVVTVVGLVVRVVEELVVRVVEVVGTMSVSGSPQCASEQAMSWSGSPTSSATRHVLDGSAQWENGNTAMSQSVGISHRGLRGSTQMHPEKNSNPSA